MRSPEMMSRLVLGHGLPRDTAFAKICSRVAGTQCEESEGYRITRYRFGDERMMPAHGRARSDGLADLSGLILP